MTKQRVVFVVPWRTDSGRREELWKFTRTWLERNHPKYEIITADCDDGPFNRGQAINRAAKAAGKWDVMVISDTDNVADPAILEEAIATAAKTGQVVMPYEVYIYMDEYSSDQFMATGSPFHAALNHKSNYAHSVLWHHHSGVQVFPRAAWDKTGGFVELPGWGYEDSMMADIIRTFTEGMTWLRGSALHMWHEPGFSGDLSMKNYRDWKNMHSQVGRPDHMRRMLARLGHVVP